MNLARVEKKLFVMSETVWVAGYDFSFELHFECDHPYQIDGEQICVLRIGAISDYPGQFAEQLRAGLRLVNSPDEHERASELVIWYPIIADLTPRTVVFDALPEADEIERHFSWPVFIKGSRQTSKHNPDLAIARDRNHYEEVRKHYLNDPILHWQQPVVREFVPLAAVAGTVPNMVPPSMEFRSFWWHGYCVGWGRYWSQVAPYACDDVRSGMALAELAAKRLQVPFLVIDVAKTRDGRWIVIECNDAQESGYAGIAPQLLWQAVLARTPAMN